MGRILAIDYGRKRTGLAVTDELKLIANPLGTVKSADTITFLKTFLRDHEVECIVVGEPRDMKNRVSESETYIAPFIRKLKQEIPGIRVERYDERFTSRIASQAIRESGLKKKDRQEKALVDTVSAVLILQSYMETLPAGLKTDKL